MQLRQLTLAMAVALAASQAFALTPTQIGAARTAKTLHEVYINGASAPTRSVYLSARTLCQPGTIHTYNADSAGTNLGSAGNFVATACTSNGTLSTVPNNEALVIYHTVDGGSFTAVEVHYAGQAAMKKRLKALDNNATCVAHAGDTITHDPGYNKCTTVTPNPTTPVDAAPQYPQGGFLDVEPNLWVDLLPGGKTASDYGDVAAGSLTQVFGVAVSTNLYRAMQAHQGITSAACTDGVGTDDWRNPACMPNLTRAQYASIAADVGGYHSDWSALVNAADASKDIRLCRRVVTSGTQASSNAFFLGSPCNRGAATAGELAPAAAQTTSPFIVIENEGTSDVKKCLDTANTLGTQYGIGVVSAENDPLAEIQTDRNDYRFVKLDGVSPEDWTDSIAGDSGKARQNGIDGKYGMVMEMTYFVPNSGSVMGPASAAAAEVLSAINTAMGDPANTNLRGIFINPQVADYTSFPDQVGKGTRFGNNCQSVLMFY